MFFLNMLGKFYCVIELNITKITCRGRMMPLFVVVQGCFVVAFLITQITWESDFQMISFYMHI